ARAQAELLAAQVDCRSAGARLALLWFHRRRVRTQLAAWRQWTAATAQDRAAEEEEGRRGLATARLARELDRIVGGRRRRILRRSMRLWHRQAERQLAHDVEVGREASSREAAARRLFAVVEGNLLRRRARVWGRLVGSAVAASGRLQREREAQERRDRLLALAGSRSSRRLLSRAWLAWKGVSAERRRRGEVHSVRAASGAIILATITRREEEEALRQAFSVWRERSDQARQRERALSRAVSCSLRSEARVERDRAVRCLARWRLAAAEGGRALADEDRASAEAALRGRAVLSILNHKRVRRLGEGFRRLVRNRDASIHESREERARREDVSRGLHALRRTVARRSQGRVASAFARWQRFAAEAGQRGNRALLVSAHRGTAARMLGSVVARREALVVSRAWTVWRSGAASAAIHDGERASADLRVAGARHAAGARLLATAMGGARRRLQTMEKHFHLARALTRVERRVELEKVRGAWGAWCRNARSAASLSRVAERGRRARMAEGLTRWRVASAERGQAEAERGRAAAENAARGRALRVLLKRRAHRQLREAFNRVLRHGAWAIYVARQEEVRADRLSRGFQVLARACARRRERSKLAAVSRWRFFVSESRRREERGLLQAKGRKAGAKALASLVSHRERSSVARAWTVWRSGAASAAMHEGERASADRRVFDARRSAGCRLLSGVLVSARRAALARAWSVWRKEIRAAADAELQTMEKHFHLARTLTRVERRTQVLERHYHVAQTVSRVLARVRERRVSRAWGLWARMAARGGSTGGPTAAARRASGSLSSFPPGLLAAARSSH
ncbi:unnamed protein product, partial [Scytosiphon promiscuus]